MRECLRRCPECPRKSPVIQGCGNPDARIVFVGEAPGKEEKIGRMPFIGKAGKEYDNYLAMAGLGRGQVWTTNATKCWWANSGEAPPDEVMHSCADFHLRRELEEGKPDLIIPMGQHAIAALKHLGFAPNSMDLEMDHGLPTRMIVDGDDPWMFNIMPVYHPAAGMRMTKLMLWLQQDFRKIRAVLSGRYKRPRDQYRKVDYREITNLYDLKMVANRDNEVPLAIDTEGVPIDGGLRYKTWCLTFSVQPGTGYMIRRPYGEVLAQFAKYVSRWRGRIYLHYALHDLPALAELGIEVPYKRVRDTMARAYHLANLPQGLKALAYRELGVQMEEFEDVVYPYSKLVMLDYFIESLSKEFERPEPFLKLDPKTGKKKMSWPQGPQAKMKKLVKELVGGKDVDLLKRWKGWKEWDRKEVERVLGPFPLPSIEHIPLHEAVRYACRDADVTLRAGLKLGGMRVRRVGR